MKKVERDETQIDHNNINEEHPKKQINVKVVKNGDQTNGKQEEKLNAEEVTKIESEYTPNLLDSNVDRKQERDSRRYDRNEKDDRRNDKSDRRYEKNNPEYEQNLIRENTYHRNERYQSRNGRPRDDNLDQEFQNYSKPSQKYDRDYEKDTRRNERDGYHEKNQKQEINMEYSREKDKKYDKYSVYDTRPIIKESDTKLEYDESILVKRTPDHFFNRNERHVADDFDKRESRKDRKRPEYDDIKKDNEYFVPERTKIRDHLRERDDLHYRDRNQDRYVDRSRERDFERGKYQEWDDKRNPRNPRFDNEFDRKREKVYPREDGKDRIIEDKNDGYKYRENDKDLFGEKEKNFTKEKNTYRDNNNFNDTKEFKMNDERYATRRNE